MKKPELKGNGEGNFFDRFEEYMEERKQWENTTLLGRLTKLWWTIKRKATGAWWFIRWETTDRYHFLDLRGPDYRRGYIDYDERFIRACFKCLEMMEEEQWGFKDLTEADLVSKDEPNDPYAAQCNIGMRGQIAEYAEFKELLRWWREDRPKLANDPNQYDIEDAMIGRLLKLRRGMWA